MAETSTVPKKVGWIYLFYQICQGMGMAVPLMYIMFFMTNYALLAPAVVAVILMVARLVDLLVCLTAGAIVTKSNFKLGKYRTWLAILPFVVQIGAFLQFLNPNVPPLAKAVIICAGYIMTHAPMSFIMTSTYGLQTKICGNDMNARLGISAKIIQGLNISTLIYSMITMPLISFFVARGANGYLIVAVIYGITMCAGAVIKVYMTREFDQYDPNFKYDPSSQVSIREMLGSTLQNPLIWVVLIKDVLLVVSQQFISGCGLYYYQYSIGNVNMQAVALTISTLLGILASFVMPPISKKMGKKTSVMASAAFAVVVNTLIALFAHQNLVAFIVINSVNTFTAAIGSVIGMNLYFDSAEYQLYKTGKDTRAFVISLNQLTMKLGLFLVAPLSAFILTRAGFVQELVNGAMVANMSNPRAFVMFMGLVPASLNLIILLVIGFGYRLTDAQAKEYADHNHKVAMENQAAAAAAAAAAGKVPAVAAD